MNVEPVVQFRMVFPLLLHPESQLRLGHDREFRQILCTVIIVRRRAGFYEFLLIERDLVSPLHELVDSLVLILFDLGRIAVQMSVQRQQIVKRIYIFEFLFNLRTLSPSL